MKGLLKPVAASPSLTQKSLLFFAGFVEWLYTHKHRADAITELNDHDQSTSAVKLWIFADRRKIPLLMNEMVDSLQKSVVTAWVLPSHRINEVYENTTTGSTLRRMVVDMNASIAGIPSMLQSAVSQNRNHAR